MLNLAFGLTSALKLSISLPSQHGGSVKDDYRKSCLSGEDILIQAAGAESTKHPKHPQQSNLLPTPRAILNRKDRPLMRGTNYTVIVSLSLII